MSKFITGKALEDSIYDIIWNAQERLMIVSPFIKLDDYFKTLFDKHVNNPKIHLVIVFGKNEGAVSKSLSKSDFEYFQKFLNISIVYVPNLHAKYYGNEKKGVITSINLHDYSFKNNIEFGVFSELSVLDAFTTTADKEAWMACWEIAESNEVVFVKRPVFEKKMLSLLLGKNYVKSDVLHNSTSQFYERYNYNQDSATKRLSDFKDELELGSQPTSRPTREEIETPTSGFCIRTGTKIPFNPKRPFSEEAYRSWAQYSNEDYPEKYCHKSGKPSNGKTSKKSPVMPIIR
ncbi:MAG: phospholipase D family protein [Flavobacteriales bacterium]